MKWRKRPPHHFPERRLPGAPRYRALLATKPAGTALVFVHGYGGDAIDTWKKFQILMPREPISEGLDIFFYGYDGVHSELLAGGQIFYEELDRLLLAPSSILNGALGQANWREPAFRYGKVVLVAHSLGAVFARRALLFANEDERAWRLDTRLVLFAPAHKGARIDLLATEATQGTKWLRVYFSYKKFRSPLIEQLAKGSEELRELEQEVTTATASRRNPFLIAREVAIAENEHVVTNGVFDGDPRPRPLRNTDHSSVCKPNSAFRDPLEIVCRHL